MALRREISRLIIVAAGATVSVVASATASMSPPWTAQDLERAADAAVAATDGSNIVTRASMLVRLADALVQAGSSGKATKILLAAGSTLPPPSDFMSSAVRGNIVERLAHLGDRSGAEALIQVDAVPATHATLLGRLGDGLALAGETAEARKQATTIALLPDSDRYPFLATSKIAAQANIAFELAAAGVTEDALAIARDLPDGLPKVRILGRVVSTLCEKRPDVSACKKQGSPAAGQAVVSAKRALADTQAGFPRLAIVELAAAALVECADPASARALIHDTIDPAQETLALGQISDSLAAAGNLDAARAIAPVPETENARDLLAGARRWIKLGNSDTARRLALKASSLALEEANEAGRALGGQSTDQSLLAGTSIVLAELGAYEAALASLQPIDLTNRKQYYPQILGIAARQKDGAAVKAILPLALEITRTTTSGGLATVPFLSMTTRSLVTAGFKEEAEKSYAELEKAVNATSGDGLSAGLATLAEVQASMGNLALASATADHAGALTAKANGLRAVAATTMSFAGAQNPPSQKEFADRFQQVSRSMPPQVAGAKAWAFASIARAMAAAGRLTDAFEVEARLETAPRDVLKAPRDNALAAISEAQEHAEDPTSSLATALRIDQPSVRWKRLLALATIAPTK